MTKQRRWLRTALFACAFNLLFPLTTYWSMVPLGADMAPALPPFFVPMMFILLGISLIMRAMVEATDITDVLIACVVFAIAFGLANMSVGIVREAGFKALIARYQPIVDALRRYNADNQEPPIKLRELVPKYLHEEQLPHNELNNRLVYLMKPIRPDVGPILIVNTGVNTNDGTHAYKMEFVPGTTKAPESDHRYRNILQIGEWICKFN